MGSEKYEENHHASQGFRINKTGDFDSSRNKVEMEV